MVDLAAHILASVRRDLLVLKEHRVIDENAYQAIIAQLPGASSLAPPRPSSAVPSPSPGQAPVSPRPPLPTRRSTSSSTASHHTTPIPAPRTSNVPKLPSRKTGDWQEMANSMTPPLPPPAAVPTPLAATSMPMPAPLAAPTPPARSTSPRPSSAPSINQQIAEAIYDYHGEDPATDLSFRKGDTIVVTEHVNQDWWRGTLNGASGIFPKNHVQEVERKVPPPGPSVAAAPNVAPAPPYPQPQPSQLPYAYPPPPSMAYHAPPMPSDHAMTSAPMPVVPPNQASNVQAMAKLFGSRAG